MRILGSCGRRVSRAGLAVGVYVVIASFAPRAEVLEAPPAAGPSPAAATPTDALALLRAGNERFVRRVPSAPVVRAAAPSAMAPIAAVLSCAESRLPAESLFDAAPGQLLVVRSLGAVADKAIVASLEYGVRALHAPVLVVMGHDACDAVRLGPSAAPDSDNFELVAKALQASRRIAGESADVRTLVLATVEQVINDVLGSSPLLRAAAAGGQLQVVGAYFDSTSGVVSFSEPVALAADGSIRH